MQRIAEEADAMDGLDDLLFEGHDSEAHARPASDSDTDDESTVSADHAGAEDFGATRGSLGSSTLNNVADDPVGVGQESDSSAAVPVRGGGSRAAPPERQPSIRMGTSVPISISRQQPGGKWGRTDGDGVISMGINDAMQSATFVPPHQLSQRDTEFLFSFTGASPSTAAKRERLKVRNAILARTGFLETPAPPALGSVPAERNAMRIISGGLSQALGSQNA